MNKQIYEEASEWLVELHAGDVDAAGQEQLDAWFRESPNHIRAFLELSSIWEDGADSDLDRGKSTDSLIAIARASTNVVPLEKMQPVLHQITQQAALGPKSRFAQRARKRILSLRSLAAASALFALLTVGFGVVRGYLNPTYSTSIGEERSIRLSDGSSIVLNSRTRVRVRFSEHERDVDLLEGQTLFHVAKDPTRPFIVRSDSARVRAVGTEFDVYRRESGTTVTVVEGQVAVIPVEPRIAGRRTQSGTLEAFDPAAAIVLVAGEQVTVTASRPPQAVHADVAAATAWTQQQLVFDSTPLIDVVKEFNRYNDRQLIVSDSSLEDFHVTGVFSSADPASLLRFLRAQRGVNIEETDRDIRIFKK